MRSDKHDDLWRKIPRTAVEFEKQFATEEACRAYWIEARWGGKPRCACCESTHVWEERGGALFECADCGHQTSLTSGTLLEKTKKPFKVWFRAIFEISARRNGISAKELQRIMGFGSYKTAWSWLHKLRAAMVRSDSEPLGPFVEMDEALVGGKASPNKELVLVAVEANGRVCLAHAANNDEATLKAFANREIAAHARVVTDGHAAYNGNSLRQRSGATSSRRTTLCGLSRKMFSFARALLLNEFNDLTPVGQVFTGMSLLLIARIWLDAWTFIALHDARPQPSPDLPRQ
jgi:Zn ribbon nucleic-acid-binding protein